MSGSISFNLPPYTEREKNHLNIAHCFCRWWESHTGYMCSKWMYYSFINCPLASNKQVNLRLFNQHKLSQPSQLGTKTEPSANFYFSKKSWVRRNQIPPKYHFKTVQKVFLALRVTCQPVGLTDGLNSFKARISLPLPPSLSLSLSLSLSWFKIALVESLL